MPEDIQLLLEYHRDRSEAAFAELVRRHVDLVYSVAMRRVGGDHHRALEVSQAVFVSMAREARRLAHHPVLAAWLHVSTRNAAANLLRAERRREHRLQQAHAMSELHDSENNASDWDQVRPVLDDSLDQLSERERQAIILRFFQNRSYAEIGTALSLQEDAARKQVARTLEKLHGLLAKRGVKSTIGALSAVMAVNAVTAAPAGVAAGLAGSALAVAATSSLAHVFNLGAAKLGVAAVVVIGVVAVAVYEKSGPTATAAIAPPHSEPAKITPAVARVETPPPPKVSAIDAPLSEALTYDAGKTVKRDAVRARAAYERAAGLGSAEAEFRLGYFYETGDGVPQSYTDARTHYARAVALGLLSAHLRIGILDLEGWGAPRDVAAAVQHITLAADAGDRSAERVLSGMYFAGIGVDKDLHRALALEEKAAREDDPEAETVVGAVLGLLHRDNAATAREWYQLSAEQSYTEGMLAMASTFFHPGATAAQVEEGRKWLQLAAEGGNGAAAFYLAAVLVHPATGSVLRGSTEEARRWLEKSRDRGEPAAAEVLQLSESMTLPQAIDEVMTISPEQRYVTRVAAEMAAVKPDASGWVRPIPTKIVQPVYPTAFRLTRTAGEAVVDFHVDSSGRVRGAKSVSATHPAFGESAALAVAGWRFIPAQKNGRGVEAHLRVPVKFDPSIIAQGPSAMKCEVRLIVRQPGANPGVRVALQLQSPGPIHPRAGRAVVTKAQDDTGADLELPSMPDLFATSVGMTSEAEMFAPAPRELAFFLGGKSTTSTKRLRVVEGYVELVLPENDSDSTVTVPGVLSKLALPIESPTLAEAGISVIVYDKAACDRFRDAKFGAGGPQDYDGGPMFARRQENSIYAKMPPEIAAKMTQGYAMKDNYLAVGIADRDGHLVGLEFRTKDGKPIRYNHNGSYHSSGMPGHPERRFDGYELPTPFPSDLQMVCWVATKQATIRVPFHFEDLAVP